MHIHITILRNAFRCYPIRGQPQSDLVGDRRDLRCEGVASVADWLESARSSLVETGQSEETLFRRVLPPP